MISIKHGLFLCQQKYIQDLLTRTKVDGAKTIMTPLATKDLLQLHDGSSPVDPTEYRRVIGALQYLSLTWPGIAFPVNKLAQFMYKPSQLRWTTAKRILRYLKGTLNDGIFLKRIENLTLQGFSDADWAGDKDTRSSTSAYLIFLGDCRISWSTQKQRAVARSSTEAEYWALASANSELIWIRSLFHELGIPIPTPPHLFCDNIGATQLSLNPVMHSRMKHIAIDMHFVYDLVSKGMLQVSHASTHDQLADLFN